MIKVFEAFAGYGSQRLALKNCNIPFDVVGISEVDGDVLLSYAAIHCNLEEELKKEVIVSEEEMKEYLLSINHFASP